MIIRLAERGVKAVLLDIEGTTTPIAFVHEVLFPFARAHLGSWLAAAAGSAEFAGISAQLASEHAEDRSRGEDVPAWTASAPDDLRTSVERYAAWLMDRDRKSPGLKRLQGLIWEQGYQAGTLRGDVYPDVPPALRRWRSAGVIVAIYSSGSELAQRRLFQSTSEGDLTPLLRGFFDTAIGSKRETASYRRIADELHLAPANVLFISDVDAELTAAEGAGQQAVLSLRPGNPPQTDASHFASIQSFDEVD